MSKSILVPAKQELTLNDPKGNAKLIFDQLDVSENTRTDYKYRIGLFLDFTHKIGLNRSSFLDFKRNLAERSDFSVATKNKYLAAARIFLKELNRKGFLPSDLTQNIKSFSQDKKHKRDGLSEEEMSRLVEKVKAMPINLETSRLRAILGLLALQGLRQIEIVRLDVRDVDLVNKTALVQGKGRDDKELVSLHPETAEVLKQYLKLNHLADGSLFPCRSNNHRNQRLTTRTIREIVKKTLENLGIDKTVHGFRHYFTTTLIKTYKGDLLQVAGYTRHRGLEMLQVYNDSIKHQADLPRYYGAFNGVSF